MKLYAILTAFIHRLRGSSRPIQKIFDITIKYGYYNRTNHDAMCFALASARRNHIITYREERNAKIAIDKYLPAPFIMLESALVGNRLPHEFDDRLAIYKNWEQRPRLK